MINQSYGPVVTESKASLLQKVLVGILLALVVAIGAGYMAVLNPGLISGLFSFGPQIAYPSQFTIEQIPYVGIHNNIGKYQQSYSRTASGAAVITVSSYWYPDQVDIENIDRIFIDPSRTGTLGVITAYFNIEDARFNVQSEVLSTGEIGKYLNDDNQIPLLTLLPVTPSEITYTPITLVVGVDTETEVITLQNYWLGRFTLTFAEYNNLQSYSETANQYLIVTPSDADNYQFTQKYQEITNFPQLIPDVYDTFVSYALADALMFSENLDVSLTYYQRVVDSSAFTSYIPPSMRVIILSRYAEILYQEQLYNEALAVVNEGIAQNTNLAAAFGTFGPYDYIYNNNEPGHQDVLSLPHIVAGDVYRALDRPSLAIIQYERALEIFPRHVGPREALERLRAESE